MSAQHTPEPWTVVAIDWAETGNARFEIKGIRRTGMADARLISAAPELLAALRGMLAIVNDSRGVAGYHLNGDTAEWDEFDEVDAARAAIAKVEGGVA